MLARALGSDFRARLAWRLYKESLCQSLLKCTRGMTLIAVFINGDEKVKLFCFADKFVIVAYVDDAVDDNK